MFFLIICCRCTNAKWESKHKHKTWKFNLKLRLARPGGFAILLGCFIYSFIHYIVQFLPFLFDKNVKDKL